MDGATLEDKVISVQFSCPKPKDVPYNQFQRQLGGADRGPQPRTPLGGSQRGRLNLMPRALLRKTGSQSTSGPGPASSSNNGSENLEKPKSNEDFRKMLLKN